MVEGASRGGRPTRSARRPGRAVAAWTVTSGSGRAAGRARRDLARAPDGTSSYFFEFSGPEQPRIAESPPRLPTRASLRRGGDLRRFESWVLTAQIRDWIV